MPDNKGSRPGVHVFIMCALMFLLGVFSGLRTVESLPPSGTFVQFGGGAVIIDTRTGYLCDAFPGPATFLPLCPQTKKFVEDSRPAPAAPVQQ